MRNISFSLTTQQFRARTKDVTRRMGWINLKVGERLMGCEKCMGRKSYEPLVRLGVIEVVNVRREKLSLMTENLSYGFQEVEREGFGVHMKWPSAFVAFFCNSHTGCTPESEITRIEFKYID